MPFHRQACCSRRRGGEEAPFFFAGAADPPTKKHRKALQKNNNRVRSEGCKKKKKKKKKKRHCNIRDLRVFGVRGHRFNVVDVARRIHHLPDQLKRPVCNRVANEQAVWQGGVAEKQLAWRAAVSCIRAAGSTAAFAVGTRGTCAHARRASRRVVLELVVAALSADVAGAVCCADVAPPKPALCVWGGVHEWFIKHAVADEGGGQ